MSYRNNRFNRRLLSLDLKVKELGYDRARAYSDRGRGAYRIIANVEFSREEIIAREKAYFARRKRKAEAAKSRLRAIGKAYLIDTLELIILNSARHRHLSILTIMREDNSGYEAARKKYRRHRNALKAIFMGDVP